MDVGEDTTGEVSGIGRNTEEGDELRASLAKDGDTVSIQRLTALVVVKAIGENARVSEVLLLAVGILCLSSSRGSKSNISRSHIEANRGRTRGLGEGADVHDTVAVVDRLTPIKCRLADIENGARVDSLLGREVKRADTELETREGVVAERRADRVVDRGLSDRRHGHNDLAEVICRKGGHDVGLARRGDALALGRDHSIKRNNETLLTLKLRDTIEHLSIEIVGLDQIDLQEDVGEGIRTIGVARALETGLSVGGAEELDHQLTTLGEREVLLGGEELGHKRKRPGAREARLVANRRRDEAARHVTRRIRGRGIGGPSSVQSRVGLPVSSEGSRSGVPGTIRTRKNLSVRPAVGQIGIVYICSVKSDSRTADEGRAIVKRDVASARGGDSGGEDSRVQVQEGRRVSKDELDDGVGRRRRTCLWLDANSASARQ